MVDTEYPGAILLAEACQMPAQVREYFGDGDEFHMGFHFPVMPRIYMSIKKEDFSSLKQILAETPEIPPNCQWCTFLRNQLSSPRSLPLLLLFFSFLTLPNKNSDELTLEMVTAEERKWMWEQFAPDPRMKINLGIRRRLGPLFDGDRRQIELAYSLLFTLPGSPILYYGDEICMGDNIWLPDRNGVRTPMQWDDTRNAGFSHSCSTYTDVVRSEEYGPQRINVKLAQADPSSMFHVIRFMISQRRKHSSFGFGTIQWVQKKTNNLSVAAYLRSHTIDKVLVVSNLSPRPQTTRFDLKQLMDLSTATAANSPSALVNSFTSGYSSVSDILTSQYYRVVNDSLALKLEPYQFLWLHLQQ
jgi:maltose alpha-D-glucosyltransferase/alpha-amylase